MLKPHLNMILQSGSRYFWAESSTWIKNDVHFLFVEVVLRNKQFEILKTKENNIALMFFKSNLDIVLSCKAQSNEADNISISKENLKPLNKVISTFSILTKEKENNQIIRMYGSN